MKTAGASRDAPEHAGEMMDGSRIKGVAIVEILRWYAAEHGHYKLVEAAQTLPPSLALHVTQPEAPTLGLQSNKWYPFELLDALCIHLVQGLSSEEKQALAADIARAGVGNTLSGIYGTLMGLLVSPELVATHFQRIWRIFLSDGDARVIIHAPDRHELRIASWPAHTPFLCDLVLYGSAAVLEVIGCKELRTSKVACVADGSPYCGYLNVWSR
jgi:hypothetical protein